MNQPHYDDRYFDTSSRGLTQTALITALYVAVTFIVAPVSFGAIQFRISEALNYLGLFKKRYVTAITLGVVIVNAILSTPLDVVVGGLHTLLSLLISRWLANRVAKRFANDQIVSFVIMACVFSAMIFLIAGMLVYVGAFPFFWQTYFTLAVSEMIAMILGGIVMYPITQRIDFDR